MKSTRSKTTFNQEVRQTYFALLKVAKRLLASIERHELRCTLIREAEPKGIIHEFVSPILYLRLESQEDTLVIRYGFEPCKEYMHLTMPFVRTVYRLTMKEATGNDIEASIRTDWCVTNPDEMYGYIEERNKHHRFELIKYKPATKQSKRVLRVA